MNLTGTRAPSVVLLFTVWAATMLVAKDRIFVDQWSPTRSELFIADADGANARKLVAGLERDYNASFSFDGEWVVFTSERHGSADIFRVRVNGMGLERLTDSPAFEDQAALAPDGNSLAFVSTRDTGSTDIHVLDLKSHQSRNLTNSPGGDYRPSWSPDGRRLAFSSDRGTNLQRSKGNWEQVQPASVYVVSADGHDLRKLSSDGQLAGSPKWSLDGASVVFYELAVDDSYRARGLATQATVESRIVAVDVATGAARIEHASGPGLKLSPQFLDANRIGYLAKSGTTAALTFSSGEKGSVGDIGNPSWSRDGRRVVYHRGPIETIPAARTPGGSLYSGDSQYDLRFASGFPAVSPDGRQLAVSERTGRGTPDDRTSLVVWNSDGTNPRRIFHVEGSLMSPNWSADGQWIVFGAGTYFVPRAARPAQIMVVRPDGSGAHALTTGAGNSGFPSWSPDGKQVVYRFWEEAGSSPANGPTPGRAAGLRILHMSDGAVRTLTTGYDNFPCWSKKGRIVFSRYVNDEFHIFAINPDGTSLTQLTKGPHDNTHPACAPNGDHVLFSTSRFGFKDEAPMSDIPQPYGELIIMKLDGSDQRPLTDNRWEEGTPAWQPVPLPGAATK